MSNKATDSLTQQFISVVRQRFQSLIRKHKITLAFIFTTVIFAGLLFAGIAESAFYLPAAIKIGLLSSILLVSCGGLYAFYRQTNLPTFTEFYHQFSKQAKRNNLSDALDLHYHTGKNTVPLQDAAIKQNLEELNLNKINNELAQYENAHSIHKYYKAGLSGALGSLILLIGFSLLQPSAMNRLAQPATQFTPPNPYEFTVEPGTLTLEQGKSFNPQISFNGEYPENLSLAFKTNIEQQYRQRNPINEQDQTAAFSSISFTTNGSYYFMMDGHRSKEFQVDVQLRPRLQRLSVNVVPPAYTQLDTTSYSYPFSNIRAYAGSEIILTGETNKPVKTINLRRSATADTVKLDSDSLNNRQYQHHWTVSSRDTVSFSMTDKVGLSNENKFRFVIEPREDQHPFANLIAPTDNIKMKSAEPLELTYEAGDDFGLTGASLQFELQRAFTDKPETGSITLPNPVMNSPQTYEWEVPKLNPKPRDVLTYWIQVRDNDRYNGAKTGQSQKLMITFPSVTEYMQELDSQEGEVTQSLDSLSQSFNQMEQEYNKFKKQLQQNPETSWEQKQQLDQVEQQRQKIDKQVEELNKKFEQIRQEIEKNNALSPETTQAYQELQKLMKEINDPELQKALEKLRNSLGEMNPEQMRKALENYEFNEEQYRQRINRTLELFKSMKMNSDLEKMAQSLEELAEQEQKISESNQNTAEEVEQQKAIEEDLEKVQEQLDKLNEKAPEQAKEQVQELQKEGSKSMQEIQKELQQNIKQLQEQQNSSQPNPDTNQQQKRIQKKMQQMANNMRSAKQQMNQQRLQVNMAALEYILYSLINLSQNQEELTKETETLPSRSQAFVDKARKEKNISSQFSVLSDSLFEVSSEIPGFSNKINKKKAEVEGYLERAVTTLDERDKSNATFTQRQSLGGINELSSMVASLLEQLQNQQQGSGSGMMSMQQMIEQMQNMSGQQKKINQQIQEMINDIQGNRLNQDQMERLNQLSRQQNQIRKQIKELQQKGNLDSGDRVLSELERMSEQVEDAINDLRGGQLDQNTMQRQENILSRMLSAQEAAQERGKKEEREATTAEDNPDSIPPDITLEELKQRIRKMLNDPNRTKFTEDYQRLIEQYFELLQKQDKQVIQ